jgi:hypothetical protein
MYRQVRPSVESLTNHVALPWVEFGRPCLEHPPPYINEGIRKTGTWQQSAAVVDVYASVGKPCLLNEGPA